MLLIFKSGAYGLHLFDRIIDFSGFSYFFMDFSGCFAVVRGAVLWISAVSATFLEIFPAVSLGLGSCFRNFSGFSYFFSEFFQLLGWDWGAVLEVLWITATQALHAINLWLCTLC